MEARASTATTGVSQTSTRRSFLFVNGLPVAIAVYLLGLSVYLSSRRIMWLDEFFAWGILTDPSLRHAMHAWLEGADSGGALYYILGHTLLAITGPSVLAARLFGAALLAGAYLLWFRVLRRVFDVRIAVVASGVLLLSTGYINYLAEVRFYAQLIAAVVLAVWLALWAQRQTRSTAVVVGLFFVVHGALVSSHLLGIVYSAMLLTGMMLCARPKRSVAAAIGGVASWSLLLFARQPIHVGGLRVAGMHVALPRVRELFTMYQSEPTALYRLNPVWYLLLLVAVLYWLRSRNGKRVLQDDARSMVFRLSPLLCATPLLFFIESWISPWPLWIARYMLPCILGISGLSGFMLESALRWEWIGRLSARAKTSVLAGTLVVMAVLHLQGVKHQVLRPAFTAAELKPLEQGVPVVVANEQLFFQLKYYESGSGRQFYYVHPDVWWFTAIEEKSDLMRTIEREGYWNGSLRTREELLGGLSDFLLLEDTGRYADLIAELHRKGWIEHLVGVQNFEGRQMPLLRLTRPKA